MTGSDFTPADMAVLRKEGFRGQVLRDLIAEGVARKTPPVVVPVPRQPGRKPGAWPPGTSPPGPVVQDTDADWDAALDEYRAWTAADCPPCGHHCECGAGCQPTDGGSK